MKRFFSLLTVLTICTMAFAFVAGSQFTETAYARPKPIYLECPYFPNDCTRGIQCQYYEACGPNLQQHMLVVTDGQCNSSSNCCGLLLYTGPCQ